MFCTLRLTKHSIQSWHWTRFVFHQFIFKFCTINFKIIIITFLYVPSLSVPEPNYYSLWSCPTHPVPSSVLVEPKSVSFVWLDKRTLLYSCRDMWNKDLIILKPDVNGSQTPIFNPWYSPVVVLLSNADYESQSTRHTTKIQIKFIKGFSRPGTPRTTCHAVGCGTWNW